MMALAASSSLPTVPSLASPVTYANQPKALVASESYLMIFTGDIHVEQLDDWMAI
jgi:hypothetical protein